MKKYIINQDQVDLLLKMLCEIPAKFSFNAILTLKSLPKSEEEGGRDVPS